MKRLLAVLIGLAVLAGCAPGAPAEEDSTGAGVNCEYRVTGEAAKPADPPPSTGVANTGTATFTLAMSAGEVKITMDRATAPCTVNSFEALAQQGFFDNTACHRLSDQGLFMLQCGDPTGTGRGGPGYSFDDELAGTRAYPAGTVAMANSGANTNGSQFFLVYEDSDLPAHYTVFGRLDAASLKVVAAMAAKGHDGRYGDGTGKPHDPATITSVTGG